MPITPEILTRETETIEIVLDCEGRTIAQLAAEQAAFIASLEGQALVHVDLPPDE